MTRILLTFLTFLVFYFPSQAQWQALNLQHNGRYDDIFFINDTVGWIAGSAGRIYKTTNGGSTWINTFSTPYYLRCIDFLTDDIGICGGLPLGDSVFYYSDDGGQNWTNIMPSLPFKIPGICGLSSPDPATVYGVGYWAKPAFMVRSLDTGQTWTYTDLSPWLEAAVDVHFVSPTKGWIAGEGDSTEGAIILYTDDGGQSFSKLFTTGVSGELVWKLQSPDGKNYYGSIEPSIATQGTNFLHSTDSGQTWVMRQVDTAFNGVQVIGFIDSLTGWTGATSNLYETTDGGNTWVMTNPGAAYNRFWKINDSVAFLSGRNIYRYGDSIPLISSLAEESITPSKVNVYPNPTQGNLALEVDLYRNSFALIELRDPKGYVLKRLWKGLLPEGKTKFDIDMEGLAPGPYFVKVKTHEEQFVERVVKK